MKKQVIDCSLPMDHPDHSKLVDMSPEEVAALKAHWAENEAKAKEPKPKTVEDRLAELEAKLKI